MKSAQHKAMFEQFKYGGSSRLLCSNRSAEIILIVLFFVSLHVVACYDAILSSFLKIFRSLRILGR